MKYKITAIGTLIFVFACLCLASVTMEYPTKKVLIEPQTQDLVNYAFSKDENTNLDNLRKEFLNPPDYARPGVYWYFMDGNMSKDAITADLESMKTVGLGHVLFLEVNVGIPRGKVDFLSEEWQTLFTYAVRECERLGITMTLGVGPGWTGSGGPWVTGAQSMKHLVYSSVQISGNDDYNTISLAKPAPMKPYFGEGNFTPELKQKWSDYYEDVTVLAFPTPMVDFKIGDITEKALYYRPPYTSMPGVKPFFSSFAMYDEPDNQTKIAVNQIIDISKFMKDDGTLEWKAPKGNWTIMRFGVRNNGAVTRPAPIPGVGFEADKLDTTSLNAHLEKFTGKLLQKIGIPDKSLQGGLKMLHMDSWEMGSQNWSSKFKEEFQKRRGYDPLPFYPVYAGFVIESLEKSERFLWDLRQTAQELVIENHALHIKKYAKKYNMGLSIEPYDMNPTADIDLGAVADVPMCEFWTKDFGYNSSFSCIQAASIAHIEGKKVVAAESFTAYLDAWKIYPGSMKNQGDWAFATGINKFFYHTYQHQVLPDNLKPGMTMGPYGIHHDRSQTWWPMSDGYHKYISRCQYLLQQGQPVADILYLTPEGAPQVFRAPASALTNDTLNTIVLSGQTKEDFLPDRKGFSFDGCSPSQLLKARVVKGKIVFPSGATYRILVLPSCETMTPNLLNKIELLVKAGAVIIGNPPRKSPSLSDYPNCDEQVASKAKQLWGELDAPAIVSKRLIGKGKIYWGAVFSQVKFPELYPNYDLTASILLEMGLIEDFKSTGPIRYTHQLNQTGDVYFVSNKTNSKTNNVCKFRVDKGQPQLWNPMTGEARRLPKYDIKKGKIIIPLQFEPYESYFIVFERTSKNSSANSKADENFAVSETLFELKNPWKLAFDPKWGGPESIVFDTLQDWTTRHEDGIKYYSGIATYINNFTLSEKLFHNKLNDIYLDLGEVNNLARVRINGKDLGVLWSAPFRLKIMDALVSGENRIEIDIANLWPNRLIGDEQKPDDGIKNGQWPEWLINGTARTSGRYTFTTYKHYKKNAVLLKSGLKGPVKLLIIKKNQQ